MILGVVSGSKHSDDALERLVRLADDEDVVLTGTVPAERKLAAILRDRGVTVEQVSRRADLYGKDDAGILEAHEIVNASEMLIALGRGRRPDRMKELWERSLGRYATPATDAWIVEALALAGPGTIVAVNGTPVAEWEPARAFVNWE